MKRTRHLAVLSSLSAAAVLVLGACGNDDGSNAATTQGSDEGAYGSECSPVGEDLEAGATETVEMQLADYVFVPGDVEVDAGIVTFATTNTGEESHELAFLPGGGQVPLSGDGEPDEDALAEAGAFELEAFPPGEDCNATYDLEPGEYTLFCIVEAPDGQTHYEKGMAGTLTVN
jgi:plastocyanin